MITRRTRRGIMLMSLVAIFTAIVARKPADMAVNPLKEVDTQLNYAMYEFRGTLLNDEGEINLEVEAPVLRNNAGSGVGTIERPHIRIRQADTRWNIEAESAIITRDQEYVSLMGRVKLNQRDSVTGQQLYIDTRDAMLNVTPRTASTESEVRIRQLNDRLDAVGMNLDMAAETYELLDQVKAHYEVPVE